MSNFEVQSFYYGGNGCTADVLESSFYVASNCVPTPVSPSSACAAVTGPLSNFAGMSWAVRTSCIAGSEVRTLGSDVLAPLQPGYTARVQFWSFASNDCSGTPASIAEINSAVTGCQKNIAQQPDPSGAIYAAEKVSIDLSGTIWRNYYSDPLCSSRSLFTSIPFQSSSTCTSSMKALLIPPSTFTERTIYKGPGCTNPTSLRLSFARETCFENPCDSILQGAVRCPTQNTLSQDTKSLFPDNNVVTMNIYVDDNCAAFDYSESIRLDVCQPFSSLNPDAINGEAIKATLSGSTYTYSVFSDSECKQLLQALVLGTDGSCGRTSGVVSGRVTSVKGMDPSAYTASLSSSGGGGSGGSSGSSGSSSSTGSSSSGGNGGSTGGSTGGTGGSAGGNTGSTSGTGSTSNGTSGSGNTSSNTSGTTGNSGSTNSGSSSTLGNGKIPSGNTSTNPPSTATDSNSPSPAFIGGIAAAIVVTLLVVIGAVVYTRRTRFSKSNVEAPKSTFPPTSPSPQNTLRTPVPKENDQDSTLGRLSSTSPPPTRTETIHVMNMNALPTDATLEKEKENPLFRNLIPAIPTPSTSIYPPLKKSEKDSAATANPNESPESWTIEQVAEWVSQNGGSREPVFEQRIDGMALTALSVEDLYTVLKISTVGDRLKFRRGLEALLVAPPTYTE